jgi:hypothetical protein
MTRRLAARGCFSVDVHAYLTLNDVPVAIVRPVSEREDFPLEHYETPLANFRHVWPLPSTRQYRLHCIPIDEQWSPC